MPSRDTASIVCRPRTGLGTSMTFGFTLVCTASRMSRPARSIAVAVFHVRSMLALLAAIIALITRVTSPPARTWLSISAVVTSMPARLAWMRELTITNEFTFRSRIPIRSSRLTRAPLTRARTYSPRNWNSTANRISRISKTKIVMPMPSAPHSSSAVVPGIWARTWKNVLIKVPFPVLRLNGPDGRAAVHDGNDFNRSPGIDHAVLADGFEAADRGELAHAGRAKLADRHAARPDADAGPARSLAGDRLKHDAFSDRRVRPELHRQGADERRGDHGTEKHAGPEPKIDQVTGHDRREDRPDAGDAEQPVRRQEQLGHQQRESDAEQEDGEL